MNYGDIFPSCKTIRQENPEGKHEEKTLTDPMNSLKERLTNNLAYFSVKQSSKSEPNNYENMVKTWVNLNS